MEPNEEQTQWPRNSISTVASCFSLPESSIQADSRAPSRASVFTIDTVYSQSSASPDLRAQYFGKPQGAPSLFRDAINNESQRRHETVLQLRGRPGHLPNVPDDGPYSAAQRASNHVVPTSSAATSTNSRGTCQHPGCGVLFKSKSHEAQHKKTHNDYACPQCGVTCRKKSDRRTHFNKSCKKLVSGSPAWKCLHPACEHILRTEFQVKEHQKEEGHADSGIQEIYGLVRPRYTCSDDGKIYRSLKDFMDHFNNPDCALNKYSTHKKLHHHERIHTLLQEGRDDVNGQHQYIYAELLRFCRRFQLPLGMWKDVVNELTDADAQDIASKLEWGLVANDGSDLSRLGFADLAEMVGLIMSPVLAIGDLRQPSSDSSGLTSQPVNGVACDPASNDTACLTPESRQEFAQSRSNITTNRHLADTAIKRMDETIDTQLALGTPAPGFHVNATKPLPSPDAYTNTTASEPLPNGAVAEHSTVVNDSEWTREKQVAFERDWCSNLTPADQAYWSKSLASDQTSSSLSTKTQHSLSRVPCSAAVNLEFAVAEDQSVTAQSSLGLRATKSKRPISTNSAYHPEAAARNHLFRTNPLPIRQGFTQPQSERDRDEHARTSGSSTQRASDVSVGDYFHWAGYYSTSESGSPSRPANQSPAVTIRQGVADPAPSQYFVPPTAPPTEPISPERPKTPGAKVKAILHKFLTPTIRELDDLPKKERTALPRRPSQSPQNSFPAGLPCTTCGKTGNPSCLSGHVDLPMPTKSRRSGGTFTFSHGSFHVDAGDALDVQLPSDMFHALDDYDLDDCMR